MVKVALLIGVSEYVDLSPLPGAAKDMKEMQRVLQDPDIVGFDGVIPLLNPELHTMESAIETLFSACQTDDLILFYFSGHAIQNESGKLYFATRNTRKTNQGKLVSSTAVSASFMHKIMSSSYSKQQVVILDCCFSCFSGSLSESLLTQEEGFVDVKNQLGGEGRAVLISSTSTQHSFEQQGTDISTYTRYIVEGLETGAADRDEDGWIRVDELHEYAARNVQKAAPAMKPEIYAIKEGYNILLGSAPSDDPKLKYRQEVEYWVNGGDGKISEIGFTKLKELRSSLKLTPNETGAIEAKVLKPYQEYNRKLQRYEQEFIKAIASKPTLINKVCTELKSLQQVLGLRDEDVIPIKTRLLTEKEITPILKDKNFYTIPRKRNFRQFVIGAFVGVVIGGTSSVAPQVIKCSPLTEQYCFGDNISLGEEILVKKSTNLYKEAGVKAFAKGDLKTAIDKFQSSLQKNPHDPEALIYLNNARIGTQKSHSIAVVASIGTDLDVASDILRGVAHAQMEAEKIKGVGLKVAIANDDNRLEQAKQIATTLANQPEVLGVVGHGTSEVTQAALRVYESQKLVTISPISTADQLSISPFLFRSVHRDSLTAKSLTNYMLKTLQLRKVAVFYNSQNTYSQGLETAFSKNVELSGGQILKFDLDDPSFSAAASVKQALRQGAEVLMLAPNTEALDTALNVVQNNRRRLSLLAGDDVYNLRSLKVGGNAAVGMVVAAPCHTARNHNSKFFEESKNLWGSEVNWRTTLSYDATRALIVALKINPTRSGVKQALDSDLNTPGACGDLKFFSTGDRRNDREQSVPVPLVKIIRDPDSDTGTGYDFDLVE